MYKILQPRAAGDIEKNNKQQIAKCVINVIISDQNIKPSKP